MAMTLLEAAKLPGHTQYKQQVMINFARDNALLRVLPFETISGSAMSFPRQETLPVTGFRKVNDTFQESTGKVANVTERLFICGGDLDVDSAIIKTQPNARGVHEAMQIASIADNWQRVAIKGDALAVEAEFDGFQVRTPAAMLIANGATAGGDALSRAKLDELLDSVYKPTHIFMSKAMRRRVSKGATDAAVGGYIQWSVDEFGRQILKYNDLPIVVLEAADGTDTVLPFSEANPGGGSSVGTSIYAARLAEDGIMGIQNAPMEVTDFGRLSNPSTKYRTTVEWLAGLAHMHKRGLGRLWGIKDAAMVA